MNASRQQNQTRKETRRLRRWALGAGLGVVAASVAACGQSGTTGDLAAGQHLHDACHGKPVAALVAFDVSGSMAAPQLSAERQQMVTDVAERVAVCGGHLRVQVFSTSSARTGTLYDQTLTPSGATENARIRRSMKDAHTAVETVAKNYSGAPGQLSPDGSDILGTYLLAGEYFDQVDDASRGGSYGAKVFMVDTDGFATSGVQISGQAMDHAQAVKLAAKASVPNLPGVQVTFAGLGKENGTPPDTAVVQGLADFYDAVCAKSHAASCTSVTDYVAGNR